MNQQFVYSFRKNKTQRKRKLIEMEIIRNLSRRIRMDFVLLTRLKVGHLQIEYE